MSVLRIEVEFQEGEIVYFKVDQEKEWMVVGYVISEGIVKYACSTPEFGVYEASAIELIRDRSVY